jgi:hypothetical protein
MFSLVIPINFKNSYYFKNRPIWLLSLPNGNLMIEESISMIQKNAKEIIIVCPSEHFKKSISKTNVIKSIENSFNKKVKIFTSNQSLTLLESIELALKKANIINSFFVKDPLNKFFFEYKNNNMLISNENNKFLNADFGFKSAKLFKKLFIHNKNFLANNSSFKKIVRDYGFEIAKIELIDDWRSLKKYRAYQRKHATLFLDIDGTLLKNGSKFVDGSWKTKPLMKNIKTIEKLQKTHNLYIVITTSRPSSEKKYLKEVFSSFNIKIDSFLFDLPHCQRILVNDYFETNPFPSALSINIERDNDNLDEYLNKILKLK